MAGRGKTGLPLGQVQILNLRNAVKSKTNKLSEQYLAALRKHLKPGSSAGLQLAAGLGHQALALGLETLDLARIHEQSLQSWMKLSHSSRSRQRVIQRARAFFAEAIAPIEKTHRPAREVDVRLNQLNQTLVRRTLESCVSARNLKRRIVQRQAAEAALKKSTKQRTRLAEESRRLQKYSQLLTREILSAQENQRRKISDQLHNEVAQILLGIHVRLLAIKQAAKANTGNLKNEIASTQKLVKQSVRIIQRFAHECGLHHET
jgi:signal transduction histidine kinase